jgi:hypothetical protein
MLPAKQRTGWAGHTQAGYSPALAEATDSNGPGASPGTHNERRLSDAARRKSVIGGSKTA